MELIDEIWNDLQEYQNKNEQICTQTIQKKCINNNCNNIDFIYQQRDGDIVCTSCGSVQESHYICDDPEWNNYVEDGVMNSNGARCGNIVDPFLI